MKKCTFKPYEGKQPYIFVSYAHKDAAKVYPILEALNNRGFRIWYDEGIAPGSEWPENIAQHLDNCAVTLAFVSENSMASDNCRREITFALSRKKAFLSIMLEQSTLPLGMELQLSAQQCVMAYAYPDMSALIDKVCQCPDLAPCQAPPVVIQKEDPKPTPVPPAPSHKMKFSRPIPILMGSGIAAVVIILVVLLVIFLPTNSPTSPQDTTAYPTSAQLSSSNSVVLAPGVDYITDVSCLPTDVYYEGLSLAVNPIDCATIPAVEGYMFLLSYNETLTVENITDSFTFSKVYLLDCPDDKKVAIEDVLTYKVIFTT